MRTFVLALKMAEREFYDAMGEYKDVFPKAALLWPGYRNIERAFGLLEFPITLKLALNVAREYVDSEFISLRAGDRILDMLETA